MTMVPARDLVCYGGYGGYCGSGGGLAAGNKLELIANQGPMAEEESRTTSLNEAAASSKQAGEENEGEEEDDDGKHERWLQLGLGSGSNPIQIGQSSRLVELDLFTDRPSAVAGESSSSGRPEMMGPSPSAIFFQNPATNLSLRPHHPAEISWGAEPRGGGWAPMASTSMMPFYPQAFRHPAMGIHPLASFEAGGPSTEARFLVVDAPRRPHAGIWFVLRASPNQRKEPTLPQIPKSYLRIKDGRMTIRLLMKYLANKLGLNNESEVEITCRGQQVSPLMTLQYVRDNIWCSRDAITLFDDSSPADHVMVLKYGRSSALD